MVLSTHHQNGSTQSLAPLLLIALLLAGYFALWPVSVEPVAWQAPRDEGYTGSFTKNNQLSTLERIELQRDVGPEDLAKDANNHVYFSLHSGDIKYLDNAGQIHDWVNTNGRPLGIEFDEQGQLWVADAFKGLLRISPKGEITTMVNKLDGALINYADDVDIASNGFVYFSDASEKFAARDHGTYAASLLDINEHGGHGRILEYNPATNRVEILAEGINFANGVTLSHDEQFVLFNETGSYRVLRVGLYGDQRGQISTVIDNLPGFPDNIAKTNNGLYWLGLVSPRNAMLDALSDSPRIRKIIERLPSFLRPQAEDYGHIIALNDQGEVIHNLQDPTGHYGQTTGALAIGNKLYVSSLHETALGVINNPNP